MGPWVKKLTFARKLETKYVNEFSIVCLGMSQTSCERVVYIDKVCTW